MDFNEFLSTYGMKILGTILTALAGYLGVVIKNLCQKYLNDKTKQDVAKTCVKAVEQIYKDLQGIGMHIRYARRKRDRCF